MRKHYTVETPAAEIGVPATLETGLSTIVNNEAARGLIRRCVIRRGRATSKRFGAARYMRGGSRNGSWSVIVPVEIILHPGLFAPDMRDELIDTFLHEVAHLIAETNALRFNTKANHGPLWRNTMRAMGRMPNRCGSAEASVRLAAKMPPMKVVAKCEGCGHEIRGHRARHKYNRSIWTHRGCGGRLRGIA